MENHARFFHARLGTAISLRVSRARSCIGLEVFRLRQRSLLKFQKNDEGYAKEIRGRRDFDAKRKEKKESACVRVGEHLHSWCSTYVFIHRIYKL